MKIAQFIDTYDVGGAETMMVNLSLALQKEGHEVVVLHAGSEYLETVCKEKGLETLMIPDRKLYKSVLTVPLFSLKFSSFLKRNKFDVLHTHLYGPITGSFLGTGLFGLKHIGTLHDVYSVKERAGRGILLRIAQLFGTKLIAVSEDMEAFYKKYIPAAKSISTIHNGIKLSVATNNPIDPLDTFDGGQSTRVVTVGRLIPLKRQLQQLEAMQDLLTNNALSMFFVGDGPEMDSLKQKVDALNLQDKVFLLGTRNDVDVILQNCDIFVLASESEGLSCSIVEAMAAGLPCVVSDVGGNSELITSEYNGYVFAKDDFDQLTSHLKKLIDSKELRSEFGEASQKKAQASFSLESMVNQYQLNYQ